MPENLGGDIKILKECDCYSMGVRMDKNRET
jgi:hypothetical protein